MHTTLLKTLKQRVVQLTMHPELNALLTSNKVGIEKEYLRVHDDATLSARSHPSALGSALMHPHITTDYSEMLLELVTPPHAGSAETLAFLNDLDTFVHQNIAADELLWPSSIPCPNPTKAEVPLAQYGSSNMGRMKTIYRSGLGYRYGRTMQTIAGVHFNYSFSPRLWSCLAQYDQFEAPDKNIRNYYLMGVIRNLMRMSWVIPYLFGCSPAVHGGFPHKTREENKLQRYDGETLYGHHATSLRMGELGYQNNLSAQDLASRALPSYNSLEQYTASLHRAVTTPLPEYEEIGVLVDGQYRQLSANILQIENEHYATVRPKCAQNKNEMRLIALERLGVEYIELRSLDLNAFSPSGIDLDQARFLEVLFWLALLLPSPEMNTQEQRRIHNNEVAVAHQGRNPQLRLQQEDQSILLREWGEEITEQLHCVATLLDKAYQTTHYTEAVAQQCALFALPQNTLSQRLLDAMNNKQQSFLEMTLGQAKFFHQQFLDKELSTIHNEEWRALAEQSIFQQQQIEANETMTLDDFISTYFQQLDQLTLDKRQA